MKNLLGALIVLVLAATASRINAGIYGDTPDARHAWAVHDNNRPTPPIITADLGKPPSDAVVLFDGTSLAAWLAGKGNEPAKWKIVDGAMQVVPGTGELRTKESFGDCQLHIEWSTPTEIKGSGQGRGNSGVFLMGMHEVQILDNFDNVTYADGQASSIYAETPPMANACRKPGEWQTYDIIFHQPIWDGTTIKHPGTITVFHNGVLVQDHWELEGLSTHCQRKPLKPYATRLPLRLQDHGNPMRFRNIWIRDIPSRYNNTTHGGPAANEVAVMALRSATAAKLFAAVNQKNPNTRESLSQMLEVITYDKADTYMTVVTTLCDAYLKTLAGLNKQALYDRKGEIISVRNECNVLLRNKVIPETFLLKTELQRLITENNLEKKK